jgi:hypothetical protein
MSTEGMTLKGFVQKRGLHVVNCHTDGSQDREDAKGAKAGYSVLYTNPIRPDDRTMKMGETAFAVEGFDATFDKQPNVRTVLSGVRGKTKHGGDVRNQLMHTVRPVGVVVQDVQYPATAAKNGPNNVNPVVTVAGIVTCPHTGDRYIRAGDAVQVYLVDETKESQYKDGNRFSKDRRVFGYRPLEFELDLAKELENVGILHDFVKMMDEHLGLEEKKVTADGFKRLMSENVQCKDAGSQLLQAIRLLAFENMRNVVGVATTSAEAGERFDLYVEPPFNVLSHAKYVNGVTIIPPKAELYTDAAGEVEGGEVEEGVVEEGVVEEGVASKPKTLTESTITKRNTPNNTGFSLFGVPIQRVGKVKVGATHESGIMKGFKKASAKAAREEAARAAALLKVKRDIANGITVPTKDV